MTVRNYLILLLTVLIIGCDSNTAENYFNNGNEIVSTGNYTDAIKLYSKAINKNPNLKEAYIQRGICYENLNQDSLAIQDYNSLLKIDKKNTLALFHLGLINFKLDSYSEAIDFYNKALDSKIISTLNDSANTPILADKTNFYKENFDVPLSQIYYERGLAYYNDRQNKNAFNDFQFCINKNYLPGESYYMTGLCWLVISDKDRACEAFKKGAFYGDSLSKEELKTTCD